MKQIKCTCTEGKLLPAIPIPGKAIDDYPDCQDCNGTGVVDVDEKWIRQGKVYKKQRLERRVTLREFCKKYDLDPVKVSRVERGLESADKPIKVAYASLVTTQA